MHRHGSRDGCLYRIVGYDCEIPVPFLASIRNGKRSVFHQSLIAPERIEKLQQGEAQEAGEWFAQAKQPVTITSDDGLRLHGWLFDPDCTAPKPHLYAICMHGYTGVPEETAKWAHRYARMGFTVLVPSQRAQDLSEGRYVGMGWLERNDLLNWIDLIASSDADARILLYGGSMGAATVMMTTGDPRLPRNVVSAIVDSGYTSARMVFIDSLRHSSRLPKPLAAGMCGCRGIVLQTLCRVRFFGSHLSAVAQTYCHSDAVHSWRTGRHRELTFSQDQLRSVLEHRSRKAHGSRRTPYGSIRRGSRTVLEHRQCLHQTRIRIVSHENCVKVHMRFSSCLSPR